MSRNSDGSISFGLMLPHFGDIATWDRLFGFAQEVESIGFDSVWVRDHLSYDPLVFDNPGRRFVDPFTTLAGIAARTSTVRLGTSVLVPFRHPLVVAQLVGGLSFLSNDRLEVGIAPGTPRKPWDALGLPFEERSVRCQETIDVLRLTAGATGPVSYSGQDTSFADVLIDPPPPADLFLWYGGGSRRAIQSATDRCNGLLPSRCPYDRLDDVLLRYRQQAGEKGKAAHVGVLPLMVLDDSREAALSRVPLPGMMEAITRRWKLDIQTVDDLDGALIAGSAADCIDAIGQLVDRGVELLIVDLRLMGAQFEETVRRVAADVIPAFRDIRVRNEE